MFLLNRISAGTSNMLKFPSSLIFLYLLLAALPALHESAAGVRLRAPQPPLLRAFESGGADGGAFVAPETHYERPCDDDERAECFRFRASS